MSEGRLKAILFASLAVNLLLIGGGVGAYVAGVRLERPGLERAHRDARDGGPRGGGGFMRALDPESRAAIRTELRGVWSETRTLRAAAREARQEVERVATQPTYDPDAVRAALAHQREADAALQAAWHDAISRALVNLQPEERQKAVRALTSERRMIGGAAGGRAHERMKRFPEENGEPPPPDGSPPDGPPPSP